MISIFSLPGEACPKGLMRERDDKTTAELSDLLFHDETISYPYDYIVNSLEAIERARTEPQYAGVLRVFGLVQRSLFYRINTLYNSSSPSEIDIAYIDAGRIIDIFEMNEAAMAKLELPLEYIEELKSEYFRFQKENPTIVDRCKLF
ncbi:MAG: hypothetical protein QW331_00325 [Candidatus Woesearchaeota archaeon]